jgi:hypothetical protein
MLLLGENEYNYVPCRTLGDGNCLFRAVSNSLYGTEDYHVELRARAMIEMLLNLNSYLDQKNYPENHMDFVLVFSRSFSDYQKMKTLSGMKRYEVSN